MASASPAAAVVAPNPPEAPAVTPQPDDVSAVPADPQGAATGPAVGATEEPPAGVDAAARSSQPEGGEVAIAAWTTLRMTPQGALNAHTADLADDQLLAALGAPGAFTVNIRADAAGVSGGDPVLDSAWVKCPKDSWCAPDQDVTVAPLGPQGAAGRWSDYTGAVWGAMGPTPGPQSDPAVPAPGNALHVVIPGSPIGAGAEPGTGTAGTWLAQLWPVITDIAELPLPGQDLALKYRDGTDGQVRRAPLELPPFPITVPVVNEVTSGSISADTLNAASGILALTLWRPQRLASDDAGHTSGPQVQDMAGLDYGLLIGDGTATVSCSPQRYSSLTGLAVDPRATWSGPTGPVTLPLLDGAPTDLPLDQSQPLGLTLDVAGCLSDASAAGVTLATGPGANLTATLLAGATPQATMTTDVVTATPVASAGVTYRLQLAP